MFTSASSIVHDVASISSGVTTTVLDSVLFVDDLVLLGRDQVKIWRRSKQIELEALGLKSTDSANGESFPEITITSEPGEPTPQ